MFKLINYIYLLLYLFIHLKKYGGQIKIVSVSPIKFNQCVSLNLFTD